MHPSFPPIARHGHRPLIGATPRVPTPGATVAPDTSDTLFGWALEMQTSRGQMLDALVRFAKAHGFPPKNLLPAKSTIAAKQNKPIRT